MEECFALSQMLKNAEDTKWELENAHVELDHVKAKCRALEAQFLAANMDHPEAKMTWMDGYVAGWDDHCKWQRQGHMGGSKAADDVISKEKTGDGDEDEYEEILVEESDSESTKASDGDA